MSLHRKKPAIDYTSPSLFPIDFFELDKDFARKDIAGDIIDRELERRRREMAKAFKQEMELPGDNVAKEAGKLLFLSFGSGSSGNCAYIGTHREGVLIDAGIDHEQVEKGLADNGIDIGGVAGILVTHDHGDHVGQAYHLLKRHRSMKLYATPKAMTGILRRHSISRRIKDYHYPIYIEHTYDIGGMQVLAFQTIHDGTDNVGFIITAGEKKFVVATDMGVISERADFYMRQANYLMIESNYDLDMLTYGPYKEFLKARIISSRGHLDNKMTATQLAAIYSNRLTDIFLCHLSEDNNKPEIALECVKTALQERGVTVVAHREASLAGLEPDTVKLDVLPRYDISELFVLR